MKTRMSMAAGIVFCAGLCLGGTQAERLAEMSRDRLGMFIHWGVYSIPADGEWLMCKDGIPKEEYNRLATYFKQPKGFSPRSWVRLAKAMGARYAVFTTRHHDGFALFDTKTTDFNSVKTAAGRDYVREFVEACRAEGVRVGLYYSIMNWQYWNAHGGKAFDQSAWDEQVRVTHEALRELMTNYGKIDYLWYDGCCAQGSTDAERMDKLWRLRELNAMVRSLQPDILINDRSHLCGDFVTPEQCLTPPPRGTAWESCITCNGMWGYRASDDNWKSAETLFRALVHCARFGGNLLINIGPRSDGSVPGGCEKELRELGRMIAECPDSIYGSERDEYTEATHEAGVVTKANGSYWLWAFNSTRLDGAKKLTQVGPRCYRVERKDGASPCNWLGGRHDIELKAGEAPVLGDNSAAGEPPKGPVEMISGAESTSVAFDLPAGGLWRLEVGYVNAEGFKDTCVETVRATGAGERFVVKTPSGKGVYARRMSPVWKAVSPKAWEVAGVFRTGVEKSRFANESVRKALCGDLVAKAAQAKFLPVPDDNDLADRSDVRLNYNYSAPDKGGVGYCLARRIVTSDRDQTVYAACGNDWWGRVIVNGEVALDYFSGSKPRAFAFKLKKGDNEVLVATHCGTGQHYMCFYDNLP